MISPAWKRRSRGDGAPESRFARFRRIWKNYARKSLLCLMEINLTLRFIWHISPRSQTRRGFTFPPTSRNVRFPHRRQTRTAPPIRDAVFFVSPARPLRKRCVVIVRPGALPLDPTKGGALGTLPGCGSGAAGPSGVQGQSPWPYFDAINSPQALSVTALSVLREKYEKCFLSFSPLEETRTVTTRPPGSHT